MKTRFVPVRRCDRACRRLKLSKVSYGKRSTIRITTIPFTPAAAAFNLVSAVLDPELFGKRKLVDLQFYHPSARSVCVAGRFGGSRPRRIPLEHLGGGAWIARLVLPSGRYEYHFLADGKRRPDPLAIELSEAESGEVNSVLVVE